MKLATFQDDGYELVDCVVRNAYNPAFEVPDMTLLQRLRVGQHVKLVFQFPPEIATRTGYPSAERMWVRIEGQEGPLWYGAIHNTPAFFEPDVLARESEVVFELRHVASLDPDDYPSLRSIQ